LLDEVAKSPQVFLPVSLPHVEVGSFFHPPVILWAGVRLVKSLFLGQGNQLVLLAVAKEDRH
jgi:hypothetical protein